MKKILLITFLSAGLLTACEELIYINGYRPLPEISIYPAFLNVPVEGDSAVTIEITTNTPIEGATVATSNDSEWFVVKELDNERAIVSVEPNPADTVRYGNILFYYNNIDCACLIANQEGIE